jgi:tetratricopeptide (TPR) repeat protein
MKRIAIGTGLVLALAMSAAPAFAQYTGGGSIKMLNTETMDPTLLYKQGVEYLQAKDYTRAVAAFREVLVKRDGDPATNFMMGVAQVGLNDLNEAKRYLSRAVSAKPDLAEAVGRLGWVEAKLGNAAGAKAQRDELVKLRDKCAGACAEAATINAAITVVDSAAPGAPKPAISAAARFNQGVDALAAKNYAEADAAFGEVLVQKPDDWEAAYMRGQAQAALNNHGGAKASFENAIKLQPGLIDAKARLAVAEKKLGNADAAAAIRASIAASQEKCAGTCAGAKPLADAIALIDSAK